MFRDSELSFPEDNMVLRRYLGPSIYIELTMTVKIMKSNREVVHRLTCQDLLPEYLESTEQITERESFDISFSINCGTGSTV